MPVCGGCTFYHKEDEERCAAEGGIVGPCAFHNIKTTRKETSCTDYVASPSPATSGKWSKEEKLKIKLLMFTRPSIPAATLQDLFGLSMPLISLIRRGKRWGNIPVPIGLMGRMAAYLATPVAQRRINTAAKLGTKLGTKLGMKPGYKKSTKRKAPRIYGPRNSRNDHLL